MKRLTLFATALMVAVSSFATIVYEPNGGINTNEYGWSTAEDMFAAFMTDAGVASFETLAYYKAQDDPLGAPNICAVLTNAAPALTTPKWAWLKSYIEGAHVSQAADGASVLPADGTGAAWRYAVGAFFIDGQRTGWPQSANFASIGVSAYAAYAAAWGAAFENPKEPTEEFTLNDAYKEGYAFMGWYANEDFSGDRIITVNASTAGTLYAKWDKIANVKEFAALDDGTQTKVMATVTINLGGKFWIQDTHGAIETYLADNTLAEGTRVVLEGTKKVEYGALVLNDAKLVSAEAGKNIEPAVTTIAAINGVNEAGDPVLSTYLGKYVRLQGVTAAYNAGQTKMYAVESTDTVEIYGLTPDSTIKADVLAGKRFNVDVIVSSFNNVAQFRTLAEKVTPASKVAVDTIAYPARGAEGEYTLVNEWIFSRTIGNYADNYPAHKDYARGMAAKDSIMYFIDREYAQLVRVDIKTGETLEPLPIKGAFQHVYQDAMGRDSIGAASSLLPYNDIKVDGAGHVLIGNCVTANGHFQVWSVDETTGEATLVLEEKLADNPKFADRTVNIRIDYFGVYGDVTGKAVIMAGNSGMGQGEKSANIEVFKWTINEGKVDGLANLVQLRTTSDAKDTYMVTKDGIATVSSSGTQVFPVDENNFYFDAHGTYATLLGKNGQILGDFKQAPHALKVFNNEGDTITMGNGYNGIAEFRIGKDYFLIVAATNNVETPKSSFAIFKFANEDKDFAQIEPMWYFPQDGMGGETNAYRTAVPTVLVDQETGVATICLYAGENGYAVYTMTGVAAPIDDALENTTIETVKARKVLRDGQVIIIRDGVEYNVLGTQVK